MTTLRTAAQQALEALERLQNAIYNIGGEHVTGLGGANDAADSAEKPMDALKAALAEPVQEPVAWLRAIDEAMVVHDCGVVDHADDYETAKRKLNTLLNTVQDIGSYFASSQQHAAQVVYQISLKNGAASSAWIDVDEAAYRSAKLHGEFDCRCLYIAPPQHAELADHSEHKHYEVRA